ncbi:MAG: folate-binding protein YgfZ [Rubrivivax sp.]|nr:folate-binding protein YgfZ [Rubrivivax sp.]
MTPTLSPAAALQGAIRLSDWGVILARGADAASFLHSQLTQSAQGLTADRARLAGYCSPKGRLLASFVLFRLDADTMALACSADLLAPTLKRLSMFVMRAKCQLSDGSAQWALWGLAGDAAGRWLGGAAQQATTWRAGVAEARPDLTWIRLPDAPATRWLCCAPAEAAAPDVPALPAQAWSWLEVRSAVPRITAATSDHFVPQMVNLELVGGVDFQKGCFPGQEVVARSQYRGTLKRRMVLAEASGPLQAGAEVHHSSDPGQPAGEVVLAAAHPDGAWSALLEVKLAMLGQEGSFRSGEVSLLPTPLPYAMPAEAA